MNPGFTRNRSLLPASSCLVVNAYRDGDISLGKAAELLKMHVLELRDRFRKEGIPLYLGPEDMDDASEEVTAMDSWFASAGSFKRMSHPRSRS